MRKKRVSCFSVFLCDCGCVCVSQHAKECSPVCLGAVWAPKRFQIYFPSEEEKRSMILMAILPCLAEDQEVSIFLTQGNLGDALQMGPGVHVLLFSPRWRNGSRVQHRVLPCTTIVLNSVFISS